MTSFIKDLEIERVAKVKRLKDMTKEELKNEIRNDIASVSEFKMPLETLAKRFVSEDADAWVDLAPNRETFNAVADYLAEGGQLPPKVIKWFAQRVIDPKLLRRKRGRKSTRALHHSLRYWVRMLSVDLQYSATDAIAVVADCAAKSPDHIRDIWYAAPVSG